MDLITGFLSTRKSVNFASGVGTDENGSGRDQVGVGKRVQGETAGIREHWGW